MTDSQVVTSLLNELDTMFDGAANDLFTGRGVVQNWANEPHIRGSFSEYLDGYAPLRKLAKPIQDYIFFAGEAIPVDWEHGYAHGAAISGKAAAYQVIHGPKSAYFLCAMFDGLDC